MASTRFSGNNLVGVEGFSGNLLEFVRTMGEHLAMLIASEMGYLASTKHLRERLSHFAPQKRPKNQPFNTRAHTLRALWEYLPLICGQNPGVRHRKVRLIVNESQ